MEYVDARDDLQRSAAWKAQHRQRELTTWDEMELSLVEAEHERFRLDHPGMTSKQLRVAFHVVPGTRRRSLSARSEEHTSELQSLMRISYAVFCLKKQPNPT